MTRRVGGAVAVVIDHVDRAGRSRAAVAAWRRWARRRPELAAFGCPAGLAAACRDARPVDQDRLLSAVLAVSAGDEWAQLTVLAGLGDRLDRVVAGWLAAGVSAVEVADMEAELVAACWHAIAAGGGVPPGRPGLALVDAAWEQVRVGGRRRRRRETWETQLPPRLPAVATTGRPTVEVLAVVVTGAMAERRLGLRSAQAVYLTRVAGYSTAEAGGLLGCTPDVVRVMRARAEHVLTRAA